MLDETNVEKTGVRELHKTLMDRRSIWMSSDVYFPIEIGVLAEICEDSGIDRVQKMILAAFKTNDEKRLPPGEESQCIQ